MDNESLTQRLLHWCRERLGAGPHSYLSELKRHAEGWSWHTFTFVLNDRDHSRGIAIRRQPEDGLLAPYDIELQYRLHATLAKLDVVPVPALYRLEMNCEVLGMPFYAMERIEGLVPVQWNASDPRVFPDEKTRQSIGEQFAAMLASIHSSRVDDFSFLAGSVAVDTSGRTRLQLQRWIAMYDASIIAQEPLLLYAINWLRAHVPSSTHSGVCHGDYRIGNFIVRDSRIVAILDWELAHIGDTTSDLAWAALPLFRGRSPLWSHLLAARDFLQIYESRGGRPVDEPAFHFWTIFNLVKASVPHLRAARAFEDRGTNDLRLAAMGHQVVHLYKHLTIALEAVS